MDAGPLENDVVSIYDEEQKVRQFFLSEDFKVANISTVMDKVQFPDKMFDVTWGNCP